MKQSGRNVELERLALQIVEQALEQEPETRADFLETKCGDDALLHSRVTTLLGHESQGELVQPPEMPNLGDIVPEMCDEAMPGGRIGAYELVRPIARGGMGWVYEAIQDKPKRRVALKILRRGFESDEARRRFQLESEVLAYLKHPGIAQVYEAGVHREQGVLGETAMPFLALEFVEKARSISAYAREEKLDTRQRVELFLECCGAVHYGHLKGVIHRDLKSGNILVGQDGKVKVIDFGIARVVTANLDTTLDFTRTGQILGTLGSMSPEQFGSDPREVDLRSDIYSLGVLLYQLLCGRRPFDLEGKSVAEVAQVVRAGQPTLPRELAPDLALDLEAVLLKAIHSERDLRYGSVSALMEDLQRYLRREPVLARAPGLFQRGRLLMRRHPLPVGLVAALVVVLSVATGVSFYQVRVAQNARLQMQDALGKAQNARVQMRDALGETQTAMKAKEQALEALELAAEAKRLALAHELSLKLDLLSFQDSVVLNILQQLKDWGLGMEHRVELLALCIKTYDAMSVSSQSDATIVSARAELYLRMGDMLGNPSMINLGRVPEAQAAFATVKRYAAALCAAGDGTAANIYGRFLLAMLSTREANISQGEGKLEKARDQFKAAQEHFSKLRDDYPEDVRFTLGLADASVALGACLIFLQVDAELIEPCFREGIALVEGLGEADRNDAESLRFLDDNYAQLATVLGHSGRAPEAIEILTSLMGRNLQRLSANASDQSLRATLGGNRIMLADAYLSNQDFVLAGEQAESAYEFFLGLVEEGDFSPATFTNLAMITAMRGTINLGWSAQLRQAGEDWRAPLEMAEEYLEEAIFLLEDRMEQEPRNPVLKAMQESATINLKQVQAKRRS